jgi:diacylglycerol kinase family enzyme
VHVKTSRAVLVHSAGEIVGATPIEIEMLPRAISIIVPHQGTVEGKS